MEGKRPNPTESDVYSVKQKSDSSSERCTTETVERQNKDRNKQICDRCLLGQFLKVMAFYMCYVCGKSFCKACFSGHDKSHGFLSLQSESEQLEREIDEYLSYLKNESDAERKRKLIKNDVCVCNYVDTRHKLDIGKGIWSMTGLTGYGYKWWVVCVDNNVCIKVFSLRSNVLQRYIRLGSQPCDVTEIIDENKTTEQDSASCSETAISETDKTPDRKRFLAVTLPYKHLILILDLSITPAIIHSKIKTVKQCFSIDFHESTIYTICGNLDLRWSVSIMSVEGVTLKTFRTDVPAWYNLSYLTVLNGNIYMTDYFSHNVVCYNDEGRVLHEITIYGSGPAGICVDRSEDKVYVCSRFYNKVYKLESDLSRYKSVLDQTTRFLEYPRAICFYSDKLYVERQSRSKFHITVVRLL